jgi:hypothetical protein
MLDRYVKNMEEGSAGNKQFGFTVLPEGAERITEDEYERLPDYVQDLINASADGELPETSPEELKSVVTTFFENSVTLGVGAGGEVDESIAVENTSSTVAQAENEPVGGGDPGAGGEVSTSE